MGEIILEMKGIAKSFGAVQALENVNFVLKKGEVMALVGENGAGKSTLMRVLSGIYTADAGEVWYKGEKIQFKNPKDAKKLGIAMIHQEFNLFPNLTVAENIFLESKEVLDHGFVSWKKMQKKAQVLMETVGGKFSVDEKIEQLSVQNKQLVEIMKALACDAEILIMDEPTSALPENEVKNLFATIRKLQSSGVSIVYVSHKMNEIQEICERITILRDGVTIQCAEISEITQQQVITLMIGKEISVLYPKLPTKLGDVVLEAEDIGDGNAVESVSFSLRKGEILGMYGLMGSGATELPELLFGLMPLTQGTISIHGQKIGLKSPENAIAQGIGYIPADRHTQGLIKSLDIRTNISLAAIRDLSTHTVINRVEENALIETYAQRLNLKYASSQQLVNSLSGGNQQKIVIAKWLATNPEILVLNDPTRGVDVGAKTEIYRLISELASQGMAIIITSSEMGEIQGMSDRIMVFNKGRIKAEFTPQEATQKNLLTAAISE